MDVRTGTSGFSYPAWRGSFYPAKLPSTRMLGYYAERLGAVELNNSFYRMPRTDQLEAWAAQTPTDFSFALKAPRAITHLKRLVDCAGDLARLCEESVVLGARRGPFLFQLPPFTRQDLPRLRGFLDAWATAASRGEQAAIEFRHPSWFDEATFALLRERGVALCVAESEVLATPLCATADWGYLRLRRTDYDDDALSRWAKRLREQPWRRCHVFFKHEDGGHGPRFAARLRELACESRPA